MASAILIVAMVPILKALTTAHVSTSIIEQRTRSLIYAQNKLDEIRARSINDFSMGGFTELNTTLDGQYLCSVIDFLVSTDLKRIFVAVGYDFNGNSTLETDEVDVTLTTLIARR